MVCPSPHQACGHRTCAVSLSSSVYLVLTVVMLISTAGLFAPTMLNPHTGGIGYWISVAFALAALLSASTSNPQIVSKKSMLSSLSSIVYPGNQGSSEFFFYVHISVGHS